MSERRRRAQYVSEPRVWVLDWIKQALGLSAETHRCYYPPGFAGALCEGQFALGQPWIITSVCCRSPCWPNTV